VDAPNYDPSALIDDGTCIFPPPQVCTGDLDQDGYISTLDLLDFLALYGSEC
jgi:hypothetical protein